MSTRPATRRLCAVLAAIAAVGVTASCAAGQIAATAFEKPTLDGTFGQVGKLKLEGVAIHSPDVNTRADGTKFYSAGDAAPMSIVIVNNGTSADTLTNVTSTAFSGWSIEATSSVDALSGTGSSVAATSAPATSPSSPPAASGPSGSGSSVTIQPGTSAAFSLQNLGTDPQTNQPKQSPKSLVLVGLSNGSSPLYPGSVVKVSFTFAHAGSKTLSVPVQIGANGSRQTVPPVPSGTAG